MVKGSCLCKGARYSVDGRISDIGHCHCSKCRKVSGVNSNGVVMAAAKRFRWDAGEELVQRYEMEDGWSTTFCRECGSPLPMQIPDSKLVWIPIGSLDEHSDIKVVQHIYVGSKGCWEIIGDDAPQHETNAPTSDA